MKVYVSVNHEEFYDFISEKNYYYYAIPREVSEADFKTYQEARDCFKKAYQKVANQWDSLKGDVDTTY